MLLSSAARALTTGRHLPSGWAASPSKTLFGCRFLRAASSTSTKAFLRGPICSASSKSIAPAASSCLNLWYNATDRFACPIVVGRRRNIHNNNNNDSSAFSVWFKLIDKKKKVVGNVACCTTLDGEITMEAVATAVKNKWTEALTGVDATSLVMYASTDHGLNISLASDAMWNPKQHGGSSVDHPIIAYVPAEIKVTSKVKNEISQNKKHSRRHSRGVRFLDSILNPLEPILSKDKTESGMSIMRDVPMLETGEVLNVVIRKISVPFWKACIGPDDDDDDDKYKPLLRLCAIGSPGTGKSTSIAFLIRLLLHERKTVVYHTRKKGWIYEFTPSLEAAHVSCVVYREPTDYSTVGDEIPSLSDSKTYYIVDPGESSDSCNLSRDAGEGPKLIIVSSPNPMHWGGKEYLKNRGGKGDSAFRFYPLWDLDELLLARAFINPDITEEEVKERFQSVGGVPRHVFGESFNFESIQKNQKSVIEQLTASDLVELCQGDALSLERVDKDLPKSSIFGIRSRADTNFEKMHFAPISQTVQASLAVRFSTVVFAKILTEKGGSNFFEYYVGSLMHGREQVELSCRTCSNAKDIEKKYVVVGGCKKVLWVKNPREAMKSKHNILFYPTTLNFELFDFGYSTKDEDGTVKYFVFQATIGETRTFNFRLIQELEDTLGWENLTICILVHEASYNKFKTDPVNPYDKEKHDQTARCDILVCRVQSPSAAFWLNLGKES